MLNHALFHEQVNEELNIGFIICRIRTHGGFRSRKEDTKFFLFFEILTEMF